METDDRVSSNGLAAAYACCERLARSHYENFPVASRLLPASLRPHVAAVYAFARVADDLADEEAGGATPDERRLRLDRWLAGLRDASEGNDIASRPDEHHLVLTALGATIRSRRLPVALFDDLISAFRQDTMTARYATWSDLLDYCRRSANPVGRLVLRIAGLESAALEAASDSLCSALQLTNFWQDLEIDWRRGRLYVPRECWQPAGADERDLDTRRLTPAWEEALAAASECTRRLFAEGRAVGDLVTGRLGFELRLTWLGGMRILERLERARFDVFRARPKLRSSDVTVILARAMMWRSSR